MARPIEFKKKINALDARIAVLRGTERAAIVLMAYILIGGYLIWTLAK